MDKDKRVIVTKPMVGICHMQVCVAQDATDEEILKVCNMENPSGTSNGWSEVMRDKREWIGAEIGGMVECADDPNRRHVLIAC